MINYSGTLASAMEWAQHGKIEDWVHAYLLSDGHNKPFSDGLKLESRIFLGPIVMPINLFTRCTGPEEHMKFRVPPENWEKHVSKLMEAKMSGADLPPIIVHYIIPEGKTEGEFELNDGNNRHEVYARLGIAETHAIVWITHRHEYDLFMERYGQYMK